MASVLPARPRHGGSRRNIAIVVSTYHDEFARGLVAHARREIEEIAPGSSIEIIDVPGSFEVPLVVQSVAERGECDAVIAFGVLLQGQTAHARLISSAVTEALMRITLATHVPVIHEILVVDDEEQARARCLGDEINRGTEAARVAVRMAEVMSQFSRRPMR
ncbi:MAG: 6,7-dimethyl-8-ribityllumazine synthase [Chthoniobacteraceae bacterium]